MVNANGISKLIVPISGSLENLFLFNAVIDKTYQKGNVINTIANIAT